MIIKVEDLLSLSRLDCGNLENLVLYFLGHVKDTTRSSMARFTTAPADILPVLCVQPIKVLVYPGITMSMGRVEGC